MMQLQNSIGYLNYKGTLKRKDLNFRNRLLKMSERKKENDYIICAKEIQTLFKDRDAQLRQYRMNGFPYTLKKTDDWGWHERIAR